MAGVLIDRSGSRREPEKLLAGLESNLSMQFDLSGCAQADPRYSYSWFRLS